MSLKPVLAVTVCLAIAVVTPFSASSQNQNASSNARDNDQSDSFVLIPDSSQEHAEDFGQRAHTNHVLHFRNEARGGSKPSGETPQSLRNVYNLPSSGGSGIIAIVDAYDYPTAENDLNVFSTQFGLPPCTTSNGCFAKVFAKGSKPASNCGWAQESALDIEWAHAMAPNAKIVLVEAASSSFTDLFAAVDVATNLIAASNSPGEVSMSWGGSEFSTESSNDSHFTHQGIVYFGASGDTGGATIYPSASPNVVAAGGTSVNRSGSGAFLSETGWSGSGGGPSKYESIPSYQIGVSGASATQRSIPDISFDANPNTGVSVYDSTSCQGLSGWLVFGGTSVASPSLAGIVNLTGQFSSSSVAELTTIYANRANAADFRDILTGTAGKNTAAAGYDFVTGIGSCLGTNGK
jgi:subtilase family serine protease